MAQPRPTSELDGNAEERAALTAAVEAARANPVSIPHDTVRGWLLKLAQGDLKAPRPQTEQ